MCGDDPEDYRIVSDDHGLLRQLSIFLSKLPSPLMDHSDPFFYILRDILKNLGFPGEPASLILSK